MSSLSNSQVQAAATRFIWVPNIPGSLELDPRSSRSSMNDAEHNKNYKGAN